MTNRYERPEIREIGSVRELTRQQYNKIGPDSDIYTALTNGAVIGSLVEV
jgi:hypothetical protein